MVRSLDYTLDLFSTAKAGERERIERFRLHGLSTELVERLARAYVKNVLINGKRVDVCSIKTQAGSLVKEISPADLAEQESRPQRRRWKNGAVHLFRTRGEPSIFPSLFARVTDSAAEPKSFATRTFRSLVVSMQLSATALRTMR